jgi:hypothetical protein
MKNELQYSKNITDINRSCMVSASAWEHGTGEASSPPNVAPLHSRDNPHYAFYKTCELLKQSNSHLHV